MTSVPTDTCFVCKRGETETPLVHLSYRGAPLRICPQHLPMLIHDPRTLADLLPGAESLEPAAHHD